MSRKRRILKMAGVKRSTKKLVVTATITEYPDDAEGKPVKPDVHLNLDNANGLGEKDVRAILQRLLAEVEEKIKVREEAAKHGGARMLAGAAVALMQPRALFPVHGR